MKFKLFKHQIFKTCKLSKNISCQQSYCRVGIWTHMVNRNLAGWNRWQDDIECVTVMNEILVDDRWPEQHTPNQGKSQIAWTQLGIKTEDTEDKLHNSF